MSDLTKTASAGGLWELTRSRDELKRWKKRFDQGL